MSGGTPVVVGAGLESLTNADTVVVPGIDVFDEPPRREVLDALRAAVARGARVASICTGAFTLAAAGVLDERPATTHWRFTARLAERYPRVRVDPRVLYIDDGDVLTSAGVMAGLDLCLHMVRNDMGAEFANSLARALVAPAHRPGGQAQYAEAPVPASPAGGLASTRAWLLERITTPVSTRDMAAHAGVSERHFLRRFHEETGTSPLQWILTQRVCVARRFLETTDLAVEIVAERSGFPSALSLREHFRRVTGTTPLSYRRTFRAASD
jgi:transcriptional regulator GlxA family with amidase domain